MFCTNCGEQMRDSDKFCAECGAPAPPRPTKPRPAAAPATVEPAAPVRAAQSTAEIAHAPMSATTSTASSSNQPELGFSAPVRSAAAPLPGTPRHQAAPPPAKSAQPAVSAQEEERALLEAEEIASVRGMAPIEVLPEPYPAAATAPATQMPVAPTAPAAPAQGYNAWLDTGPAPTPVPAARAKAVRSPAPAERPSKAVADPVAKDENFFYFYDEATAPKQNRKLLVILLVVFALGVAGIIFLMSRSPAKKPPAGNVTISISPTNADIITGQAQDFAATVTGDGDTDVTWSVVEGSSGGKVVNRGAQAQGGTVAITGVYVAPDMPGTYHVIATSKADPSKSATAEVLVNTK